MQVVIDGFVLKNSPGKNGVAYLDILDEDDNCGTMNIGIPGADGLKKKDEIHAELVCDLRTWDGSNYLKVVDVIALEKTNK